MFSVFKEWFGVLIGWVFLGFAYATVMGIVCLIIADIAGWKFTNEFGIFLWVVGTVIAAVKIKGTNYFK